jgi:hypothetical protein
VVRGLAALSLVLLFDSSHSEGTTSDEDYQDGGPAVEPSAQRMVVFCTQRGTGAGLTRVLVSAGERSLEGVRLDDGKYIRAQLDEAGLMVLARALEVSFIEIATGSLNGYTGVPTRHSSGKCRR